MTFETLERIRVFVYGAGRAAKIAAQNCHLNGYHTVALEHENEGKMADLILQDLAHEYGDLHATPKA